MNNSPVHISAMNNHIFDLRPELANDPNGEERARMLARLRGLREDCEMALRGLHDRETHDNIQASIAAVKTAIRIIENLPREQPKTGN